MPPTELRERFNSGRYWERVQSGELTAKVTRDAHPAPPLSGQPHCTRSQEVFYIDSDDCEVARIHQYLLTDGTLGGSGRPDPKMVFEGGVMYRLEKRRD